MTLTGRVRGAVAAFAVAAGLAGCGVQFDEGALTVPTTSTDTATALPAPRPGRVRIAAATAPSLTRATISTAARTDAVVVATTRDRAYRDLCAGRVDAIEVTGPVPQAIATACRRAGITLLAPIPVAADAVVLAIATGAGAGRGCLDAAQVTATLRRGSTVRRASALGLGPGPLRVVGRGPGSPAFALLGRVVLARDAATARDVRADYRARGSDALVLRELTAGSGGTATLARRVDRYARALRERTRAARARFLRRAENEGVRRVAAEIRRVAEDYRRRGIAVDRAEFLARSRRLVDLARRQARQRAARVYDERLAAQVARYRDTRRGTAGASPALGILRYGAAERAGAALRPIAVRSVTAAVEPPAPDCVPPTRATVAAGSYPLSERTVLVTSRQALTREPVRELLSSVVADSRQIADDLGLVALTAAQVDAGVRTLRGPRSR